MGCIEEVVDLVSAAIPARASILQGAPRHGRRWQRSRGQSASEGAQTHSLRVYCDAPILVCALIALAGGAASFTPNVSTTGEFLQTNSGSLTLNGASPTGQSCIITSPFDQSGTQDGTLETGLGGPVATLTGTGVTTETPPTPRRSSWARRSRSLRRSSPSSPPPTSPQPWSLEAVSSRPLRSLLVARGPRSGPRPRKRCGGSLNRSWPGPARPRPSFTSRQPITLAAPPSERSDQADGLRSGGSGGGPGQPAGCVILISLNPVNNW